jgi:hypothetical protein
MKKKIFFIVWGNPKFYQTLVSLSKYLSQKDYKVYILAQKINTKEDIIENIDFGRHSKILYHPLHFSYFPNLFNFFTFIIYSLFLFLNFRPANTVLFNQHALFCAPLIKLFKKKNHKIIYHNFDFDLLSNLKTIREKLLRFFEIYLSTICDYLIFPTISRAKIFKKDSNILNTKLLEFKNCFPKNFSPKKSSKFDTFLKKNNLHNKRIICHLGTISSGHFIANIIKSAKYINNNYIVVIAGTVRNKYNVSLIELINKFNLSNKVFLFEDVKNSLWYEILFKSDLGLCFYEDTNLSHNHMSGTSQKFNNYVFANKPMIVNNNNDFSQFKKSFDIFDTVSPNDPKKIALQINFLLTNKARYYKIKENLKISFLKELNFEVQFKKSYETFL